MLFHYDGAVDEWRDLDWSDSVLHVSAINQTKWYYKLLFFSIYYILLDKIVTCLLSLMWNRWFAKRFLHPDIVAEYNYIFLWDEDLGVENFNPERYAFLPF